LASSAAKSTILSGRDYGDVQVEMSIDITSGGQTNRLNLAGLDSEGSAFVKSLNAFLSEHWPGA
jgi:hypothetical protein